VAVDTVAVDTEAEAADTVEQQEPEVQLVLRVALVLREQRAAAAR